MSISTLDTLVDKILCYDYFQQGFSLKQIGKQAKADPNTVRAWIVAMPGGSLLASMRAHERIAAHEARYRQAYPGHDCRSYARTHLKPDHELYMEEAAVRLFNAEHETGINECENAFSEQFGGL